MRTVDGIYQALAADFFTGTGQQTSASGDLAARFYAVAAQIYALYVQADWTRRQCFPQSAEGEQLDAHAQLRGLSRRQAAKATGAVRFYVDEERTFDTQVPEGTVCMTADGVRFVTTQGGSVTAGGTHIDLSVEAVEPGAAGNVPAGSVVFLAVPPVGVTACANLEAFSNGQDTEDDEALRARVLETFRRLANGANKVFYEQQAMSFDGVAAVTVLPKNRGVGTVDVVIAAQGGLPDDDLVQAVQDHFDSVREIAVDVGVLEPEVETVDVAVTLTVEAGYDFDDVAQAVEDALQGWFTGERLGWPVLRAQLTALLFQVDGVANCVLTQPAADVAADSVTLPQLGQVTVSQAQMG